MSARGRAAPWRPLQRVPVPAGITAAQPEFTECWLNAQYQVLVRHYVDDRLLRTMAHLSIKRRDRDAVHDWRHLQRIKSEVVGPECEAVELYPAESRLVDGANQYHLWALTTPGERWPIGFTDGRQVADAPPGALWRQRPLDPTLTWPDDDAAGQPARPTT